MASSGYDVSTSFVILIPREPSARRRKRASAQRKEEARARASSCWSWVWGEEQRQADDDGQLEMNDFAVLKADPGQVFWPAQVTTDNTASAPPTTDDVMFLGVVPCPDADLIRGVSPQSHDAGNCSNLMEETKTFSSTESLRQLSQQLNGLVSEVPQDWGPERR
uniref:Golgin A2 like 1 n=1 Tax=Rattus norvegicus TaxID=10116 RepID=M0R5N1_RAT|nr:uncharacterized protein LOC102547011 isoform X2 [Rattus norvegicus]|eukprot:XP_008759910.1 PREDICTED: uncharacterized protein LOC102547011 isoform X2 [Rattus norvegicus]